MNSLITAKQKKTDNNEDGYTISNFWFSADKLEQNDSFKNIWNLGLEYTSFDIFNPTNEHVELIDYDLYERLIKTLDNFYGAFKNTSKDDLNKLFYSSWESDSKFRFIPDYIENPNFNSKNTFKEPKFIPRTITRTQRVVFHSICCYFANGQYNEVNFKQWLRIVWNIVENANITGTQSMIGAMRLIDDLAYFSHDIYSYLKVRDISKDFAKEQMEEEKEKAKQILSDNTNSWENKFIEAERTAFFNGSIRFLFRTDVNTYDWNNFDKRLVKSKLYFDIKGVTDIYKKNAILLRTLISKFSEFNHFEGEILDNNADSWKKILHDEKLISVLNQFFNIDDINAIDFYSFSSSIKNNSRLRDFQNDLCKSTILNCISPKSSFHWWLNNKYSLFPYRNKSNILVLADKRNQIISALDGNIIEVDNWQRVKNLPYFKGWEINFTSKLNNKKYQWWDSLKEQTENSEWKVVPDVNLDNLEEYLNRC